MTNIKHKIFKTILILFILQIIFVIGSTSVVFAKPPDFVPATPDDAEGETSSEGQGGTSWWDDILNSGKGFLQIGKDAASKGEITTETSENSTITIGLPSDIDLQVIINNIFNILFPLGVGITVIIGGVLGIKFMVASAEDKAKVKESLVPYVIGCAVIYGAFGIWRLAITIFSQLS